MIKAGTPNRHAAIMADLAKTLGLDLPRALTSGKVSPDEWCEALTRCADCREGAGCRKWMAAFAGRRAATAPGFCRNSALMDRLLTAQMTPHVLASGERKNHGNAK